MARDEKWRPVQRFPFKVIGLQLIHKGVKAHPTGEIYLKTIFPSEL